MHTARDDPGGPEEMTDAQIDDENAGQIIRGNEGSIAAAEGKSRVGSEP